MSEYQYYEFLAVDCPLGERELRELRALSTRARITPTNFVNTYNWGDFRGDPNVLMKKYFDAFLYLANWGTHRLMLRLPKRLFDVKMAAAYCSGEAVSVRAKGQYSILEFNSEDEEGDWEHTGEGWLSSIIPVRAELAAGDLRGLYLGWLLCAQLGEFEESEVEPPLPPNLRSLSGSLKALADFLRIDPDLIAVAAQGSQQVAQRRAQDRLGTWIHGLSAAEKNEILLQLTKGNSPEIRAELLQRFDQARTNWRQPDPNRRSLRTIGELLAAAKARAEERRRRAAERDAKERERHERAQAIAREKHLSALAKREASAWQKVDILIATKRPTDYDVAVTLLKDLRDVGVWRKRVGTFEKRIGQLRERHASRPSLLSRFDKEGMGRRT